MSRFKPGDRVELVDEVTSGIVVSVTPAGLQLRTSDGFVLEVSPDNVILLPGDGDVVLGRGDFSNAPKDSDKRTPKGKKTGRRPRQLPPMEVDLHIEKLVPDSRGLNTIDILNYQMEAAKGQLEFALRKKIQRIVFIHGVGQGILREELQTLFRRYEGLSVRDADPRFYGMGATEVYITQAGMR
jgi:hypothetical protein